MNTEQKESLLMKLHSAEIAMESARELVAAARLWVTTQELIPSAAQTAVAEPENLVVGKVDTATGGCEGVKGKRRAKCRVAGCDALHFNGRGKRCNKCAPELPNVVEVAT